MFAFPADNPSPLPTGQDMFAWLSPGEHIHHHLYKVFLIYDHWQINHQKHEKVAWPSAKVLIGWRGEEVLGSQNGFCTLRNRHIWEDNLLQECFPGEESPQAQWSQQCIWTRYEWSNFLACHGRQGAILGTGPSPQAQSAFQACTDATICPDSCTKFEIWKVPPDLIWRDSFKTHM